MTWGRVHDHSGRLVDDSQVFVLVHHLQRDRFGCGLIDVGLRDLELNNVTRCNSIRRIGRPAVDKDQVALDETCGSRAAEVSSVLREEAVEPGRRGRRDQAVSGFRRT
jgi:hypothetical protein